MRSKEGVERGRERGASRRAVGRGCEGPRKADGDETDRQEPDARLEARGGKEPSRTSYL